jgi:5-methylcytosine-specific restriction endonuclease McrA
MTGEKQKRAAYERRRGKCLKCKKSFAIEAMEADHKKPWQTG